MTLSKKPSLRRDSRDIEKAARKFVELHLFDDHDPYCSPNYLKPSPQEVSKLLVRFAQRHGAKVRRETLKEYGDVLKDLPVDLNLLTNNIVRLSCEKSLDAAAHKINGNSARLVAEIRSKLLPALDKIAALTPRGPEKGRRAK